MPVSMLDTVALIDYYHGHPGVLPYLEAILDGKTNSAFNSNE